VISIERKPGTSLSRMLLAASLIVFGLAAPSTAQDNPFAPGWDLDLAGSNIHFQSIKKMTKVESSSFATFGGTIEPGGQAKVTVLLESVDTKIDLRNVRMRFLFFETFKFPEATISLQLTPDMVAGLPGLGRKTLTVPYTFEIHGVQKQMESEITVTLINDDMISVASAAPIAIGFEEFGLTENLAKIAEAAGGISIVPSATITFDFVFKRRGGTGAAVVASTTTAPAAQAAPSGALEAAGDFSPEACLGRFEILSRTGNIYFRTASARLDGESAALLNSIVDIVNRCPGMIIEVAGHTDSDGGEGTNQALSEKRAQSVVRYLADHGVAVERVRAVGYGESRPFVANDSAYNKSRNRRIEFSVPGG
jgi:OOP family OmpA-OmpF porin